MMNRKDNKKTNTYSLIALMTSFCAMLFASTAYAEIYRWVDSNGRTHFSDQAPNNKQVPLAVMPYDVKVGGQTDNNEDKDNEVLTESDRNVTEDAIDYESILKAKEARILAEKKRQAEQKEQQATAKDKAEQEKQQQASCDNARTRLAVLSMSISAYHDAEGDVRLNWANDVYDGERSYISDSDRDEYLSQAKEAVQSHCKDPNDKDKQEDASKRWIRSQYCLLHKARLDVVNRPETRAMRSDVRKQEDLVEEYCDNSASILSSEYPEITIYPKSSPSSAYGLLPLASR